MSVGGERVVESTLVVGATSREELDSSSPLAQLRTSEVQRDDEPSLGCCCCCGVEASTLRPNPVVAACSAPRVVQVAWDVALGFHSSLDVLRSPGTTLTT